MNKREIASMFSGMRFYEMRNVVFSFGQNLLWRRELVKFTKGYLLDVGTGPGIIPRIYRSGFSIGVDISYEMIKNARGKALLVVGDGEKLPFKNQKFDTITAAFSFRNLPNKEEALREFYRVLKPCGRLLILEMKISKWDIPNLIYVLFMIVLSPFLFGNPRDYVYLLKSLLNFPKDEHIVKILRDNGFKDVKIKRFYPSIARIFIAEK